MKTFKTFLALAFIIMAYSCYAQDYYTLSKNYTITIQGTSNLHPWDETVGTASGKGSVKWNQDGSFDLDALNIIMDVHSIKGDGSIMDNKTYSALKADANPEITFNLSAPLVSVKPGTAANTFYAKGSLTIAGVTRVIYMQVKISAPQKGQLVFEGSQIISMADYGISPPTALFGTLKTGDAITLNFKTSFSQTID